MSDTSKKYYEKPDYKYWILAVVLIIWLLRYFAWYAPSPLLTTIMKDLNIDYSLSGSLVSIVSLMSAIFALGGSLITDRFGPKKALSIALFLCGLGSVLTAFAGSYAFLMFCRVIVGISIGISSPLGAVFYNMWFTAKEKPWVNSAHNIVSNFGATLVFLIVIPMFIAFGSWQISLALVGIVIFLFLLLFATTVTERNEGEAVTKAELLTRKKAQKEEEKRLPLSQRNGMLMALKNRNIIMLIIVSIAQLFSASAYNTYLPAFFQQELGVEMAAASYISSIGPFAKAIGALLGGVLAVALGRRKPVWVLSFVLILFPSISLYLSKSFNPLLFVWIMLVGIGNGIAAPLFMLCTMEVPNANAKIVAGGMAVANSAGQLFSFFTTAIFAPLITKFGMGMGLVITALPVIICIAAALGMVETGPKTKKAAAV